MRSNYDDLQCQNDVFFKVPHRQVHGFPPSKRVLYHSFWEMTWRWIKRLNEEKTQILKPRWATTWHPKEEYTVCLSNWILGAKQSVTARWMASSLCSDTDAARMALLWQLLEEVTTHHPGIQACDTLNLCSVWAHCTCAADRESVKWPVHHNEIN